MLRYKVDFMRHFYGLLEASKAHGATLSLDVQTMAATVKTAERETQLHPQFILRHSDGKFYYTADMRPDTVGFAGWRPYKHKLWPLGQGKLAFKEAAVRLGLHTPRWTLTPDEVTFGYLVKESKSSFGYGIRGPFMPTDRSSPEARLGKDEFCEEWIVGRIAKVWYWNEAPAAVELFDMPRVTGDGKHSFKELVQHALGRETGVPNVLDKLAVVQGFRPGDIVPSGREVIADYRYASPLNPTIYRNYNILADIRGTPVYTQLERVGALLYGAITPDNRPDVAYTADAIVDEHDKVWLLEMNCNPQLHPDIYAPMMVSLVGSADVPR